MQLLLPLVETFNHANAKRSISARPSDVPTNGPRIRRDENDEFVSQDQIHRAVTQKQSHKQRLTWHLSNSSMEKLCNWLPESYFYGFERCWGSACCLSEHDEKHLKGIQCRPLQKFLCGKFNHPPTPDWHFIWSHVVRLWTLTASFPINGS